jgi:O-acetylhomoserine (thiol)-lyase
MRLKSRAIHFGYEKDNQKAMAVPIYQTTAYEFRDSAHAANLFELKESGNIYTRINNPTTDVFEKRFASLEGGVAALATSSGMAAISYSILNLAQNGDNIIYANKLYGGSTTLFTHTIKRFGIEARAFDIDKPKEIEKLIDDNTKAIFIESITNPTVDVPDFDKIIEIADRYNIILIVDNTVATPILCRPLELGADIVVHSSSKYTTGQGLAIGGIMVEGKKAAKKLANNPRYEHFSTPDESYHGLVYLNAGKPAFTLRARLALLRDLGAVTSPFNSWLYIQGIETLSLRMKAHSKSAKKIAKFLKKHPKVVEVRYPYLKGDKNYKLAKKYLKGGSGLLSFRVRDFESAKKIANSTKIFSLVVNIGDSKSIITHPASTTHQQLSQEELKSAGIDEGLIRLSIGLEDVRDLIDDLKRALDS